MPADRALELSAAVLGSGLSPKQVQQRVAARYPEAAELPVRPELDSLLEAHGLHFNPTANKYERPGEQLGADLGTTFSSLTRVSSSVPAVLRAPEAKVMAKRDFDERIQNALERRSLRVLGVVADRAETAALALQSRFGLEPVCFDKRLSDHLRKAVQEANIPNAEVVYQTDHDGPTGAAWPMLCKLADQAATTLADELFPPTEPLLLVQPGLIARYHLDGFLNRLIQASQQDEAQAILLLVPAHETGGIPKINGELTIGSILPSQALWIPRAWLSANEKAPAA